MKILLFGIGASRGKQALERELGRLGHETFVENSCDAALARIEEAEIRVVIADGRLPKFDWIDLCRRLRENRAMPYVYVILIESGDADQSHEEWAIDAGVDDFLCDPADGLELRRRLRPAAYRVSATRRMRELGEVPRVPVE